MLSKLIADIETELEKVTMPGPVTFGKYYYATMILTVICLACAITSLIISTHADVYIKTDIVGTGSGSSYHEGRLSESSGFRNASTEYHYEGMRTAETTTQVSEFMMAGGDGSYWNYTGPGRRKTLRVRTSCESV